MAIKGKGRTKAGRRAPARGPRPGFVEPPKPLWRRRWFRWTLVGVAAAGAAAIVLLHRHNVRRLVAGTEHRFRPRRSAGASG